MPFNLMFPFEMNDLMKGFFISLRGIAEMLRLTEWRAGKVEWTARLFGLASMLRYECQNSKFKQKQSKSRLPFPRLFILKFHAYTVTVYKWKFQWRCWRYDTWHLQTIPWKKESMKLFLFYIFPLLVLPGKLTKLSRNQEVIEKMEIN